MFGSSSHEEVTCNEASFGRTSPEAVSSIHWPFRRMQQELSAVQKLRSRLIVIGQHVMSGSRGEYSEAWFSTTFGSARSKKRAIDKGTHTLLAPTADITSEILRQSDDDRGFNPSPSLGLRIFPFYLQLKVDNQMRKHFFFINESVWTLKNHMSILLDANTISRRSWCRL